MAIVCHFPVTIRVNGSVNDKLLAELSADLEQALVDRMVAARRELERRGVTAASVVSGEPVEEIFSPERLERPNGHGWPGQEGSYAGGYRIPSYDGGGRLTVIRWKRSAVPAGKAASILARITLRVPTSNVLWLLDPGSSPGLEWVSRLQVDLQDVIPETDLWLELFRVRDEPIEADSLFDVFQRYLETRLPTLGGGFFGGRIFLAYRASMIEEHIGRKLDDFFRQAEVPTPDQMDPVAIRTTLILAYVVYPPTLERYMAPKQLVAAQAAIREALTKEPIGRFDDIVRNPERFVDQLKGPDDQLVAVLMGPEGNEQKQAVSLRVLRKAIENVRLARANPLLYGYFKKEPPASLQAHYSQYNPTYIFTSQPQEVTTSSDHVTVSIIQQWLVSYMQYLIFTFDEVANPTHSDRQFEINEIVALRIGGSPHSPAPEDKVIEILIPAASLLDAFAQINRSMWNREAIMAGFREFEHLTEALMIYGAIGAVGKVAAAAALTRRLAVIEIAGLSGEVALNIILPAVSIWVGANKERLQKTAFGSAFVKTVDWVNYLLLAYGLGRLALGGLRIFKAKFIKVPLSDQGEGYREALAQLEDLIKKAEVGTGQESAELIAQAVGDSGKAFEGLAEQELRDAAKLAAERNPDIARRALMAETETGLNRYIEALATELEAVGSTPEQIAKMREAIAALNLSRRTAISRIADPATLERLASTRDPGKVRESGQQLIAEWEARRATALSEGNKAAARDLKRRIDALAKTLGETGAPATAGLAAEGAKLGEAVTASKYLTGVAAEGGESMLQRLWLLFREKHAAGTGEEFEAYVNIIQNHFRGNFGEFEVAFRLGESYILLKPPDTLVTVPGTDLIAIPKGGGDALLIDNKAMSHTQLNDVDALTGNLPKNLLKDIDAFAALAKKTNLPAEFGDVLMRLKAAQAEVKPIVADATKGLNADQAKRRLFDPEVQKRIGEVLAKYHIKRVVTNAGGDIARVSTELEAMHIDFLDLNK